MVEPLNIMPDQVTAGESLAVKVVLTDQTPAGGWSLAYRFAASNPITATGTVDGDGWMITLSPAQTITLTPGPMLFDAIASKADIAIAVDRGTILVLSSPAAVPKWKTILDSIDAAIAGYASNPNRSIGMGDMQVTYRSLEELKNLRAYAVSMLRKETGTAKPRIIRAVFR